MTTLTRRDWLALTMGAGATLAFDPQRLWAQGKLLTRAIPSSGEQIPVIGLGSSATFAQVARSEDIDALREVFKVMADRGATVFDTAPGYGASEEVSGRIINTASESGLYGQAGQINYAAAKMGIVAMTIVLAREMKKYAVTANVICPRARTRMTETVAGAADFMSGDEWDPEQIAPVVGFLASEEAADISGQVFVVWGTKVHVMDGFTLAGTLDRGEGRFTPEELLARKDELFADRSSKIPKMGFGF